ncbi:MAG: orotidine-5'-phosphate decarboxylase [Bacteroidota bacterium]
MMDKLYQSVQEKGPICIGLDTSVDYLPETIIRRFDSVEDRLYAFNQAIIDSTKDVAAAFKVQIAYYEAQGLQGLKAYKRTLDYIKTNRIPVIADVKRGDISKTAQMYAKAHFSGDFEVDMITVNMYMGSDTLEPYEEYFKSGKGIFVLLKTSNPGSGDIQNMITQSNEYVYQRIIEILEKKGKPFLGTSGYSSIGAVVGCTHVEDGIAIRKKMPNTFFLVPGYGAQGGTARDVSNYLLKRNGGVINSSRGIILAYKKEKWNHLQFDEAAREAVLEMKNAILAELNQMKEGD